MVTEIELKILNYMRENGELNVPPTDELMKYFGGEDMLSKAIINLERKKQIKIEKWDGSGGVYILV